jgi:hypothetical protein
MRCSSCHRWLHALCSLPAALTPTDCPEDTYWTCPCCSAVNTVRLHWLGWLSAFCIAKSEGSSVALSGTHTVCGVCACMH